MTKYSEEQIKSVEDRYNARFGNVDELRERLFPADHLIAKWVRILERAIETGNRLTPRQVSWRLGPIFGPCIPGMDPEDFRKLTAKIQALGYLLDVAEAYAEKIGYGPKLDEDGLVVIHDDKGEIIDRIALPEDEEED